MSRREGRDSLSKRLHSRSEREPSPKKQRRDGKPATERTHSSSRHLDIVDTTDRDQKQRRRLQDALPLEVPPAPETTVQTDTPKEGLVRKVDGLPDGIKPSTDATEVPRARSYFQQDDDRGNTGQGGRSFGRKATDPREPRGDRVRDKAEAHEFRRKDERTWSHADDKKVWRHDRFFELEAEAPPARKRPAFSERKMPAEPEFGTAAKGPEASWLPSDQPVVDSVRRDERGGHHSRGPDKSERPFVRVDERNGRRGAGGPLYREEMPRPSYQSRDRFDGGDVRGGDRFSGRYGERNGYRPGGGVQMDKWKHDLFAEVNRSPTPKNEEEQIAKVEALLGL